MRTIFLTGPTAVGKSAVAFVLAERLSAEIVSADSMQVYRGMDIGTAKPTVTEQQQVRHHLIDICEVNTPFDVKQFTDLARNAIHSIRQRGKTALVVGGTGLYIRALRLGLFEGPSRDPSIRAKLEVMSTDTLFAELQRVDPQTAASIDARNPRRLVRALEVFYLTGKPISKLQREWKQGATTTVARDVMATGADTLDQSPLFCLQRERSELHRRIEQRIDAQLAAGWIDEVRQLMGQGIERNVTAMQAAGYRELASHLRGQLSLADAVTQTRARTRQLARRQITWLRREPAVTWINIEPAEPPTATAQRIIDHLSVRSAAASC